MIQQPKKRPIVVVKPRKVNTIQENEELVLKNQNLQQTPRKVHELLRKNQDNEQQSKSHQRTASEELKDAEKLRLEKPHLFEKYDPTVGSPEIPFWNSLLTYFGVLIVLQIFGGIQDILRSKFNKKRDGEHQQSPDLKTFTPLYTSYEGFVIRNIYSRVKACFDKPICSTPGAKIDLVTRNSTCDTYQIKYTYPGTVDKGKMNLGTGLQLDSS